jgi:lysophospholipase L1-like esterase
LNSGVANATRLSALVYRGLKPTAKVSRRYVAKRLMMSSYKSFANPPMPRSLILPSTCLLFSFSSPPVMARPTVLVAFGDSTTALCKNLEICATLLEKELTAKGIQAKVFAGVGGNNTNDGRLRLQTEVLSRNLDVALQFGISDSSSRQPISRVC